MDSLELGVACREKNLRPRSSAAGRHFDPMVHFYKDQILELYNPALMALNQHTLASLCSWKLRESQPPPPAQLHRDGAVQFPPNQPLLPQCAAKSHTGAVYAPRTESELS